MNRQRDMKRTAALVSVLLAAGLWPAYARWLDARPAAERDIWNHTIVADRRAWVMVRSGVRRAEGIRLLGR